MMYDLDKVNRDNQGYPVKRFRINKKNTSLCSTYIKLWNSLPQSEMIANNGFEMISDTFVTESFIKGS